MSDKVLKRGSSGDEVASLQKRLINLGFQMELDGQFGPAVEDAVKEMQTMFGYDVDGKVGPATASLIEAQASRAWSLAAEDGIKRALESQGKQTAKGNLAGADLQRTLKKGVEGPDVKYLQRRLGVLGIKVDPDGKFGEGTDQAVRKLQESFGYTVDGIVGEGTHKLINAQIGHGWKAG